ncbi:MAG: AAA family ATPase [Deltaproteobacteria bacterium]|nr:AAA family ATPase [Deltaproteobacteria bacterium]
MNLLESFIGKPVPLPRTGTWPESVHVFDERSMHAVNAAMAAGRPLLVRGEPGTGKSQLARAAAHALGRLFVSEVVNSRTEGQDLQYHFDAVARLGEAQALCSTARGEEVGRLLAAERYLSPGPLWWVFDWQSATEQYGRCRHNIRRPQPPEDWSPAKGCVLLIDEIDKADADLPNSLLETLGNGAFTVPYLDRAVGLSGEAAAPLVIITTNEERELPGAFIRRCLVLQLSLPADDAEFVDWLVVRGGHHFQQSCFPAVYEKAAKQLLGDRREARRQGLTPPGQAEYLDMIRAVCRMTGGVAKEQREKAQLAVLEQISEFALKKYPPENQ